MGIKMIGGKYTQADIVEGRKVLSNGAVAGYVMNNGKKVWRIVQGASGDYLNSVRARGERQHKPISLRAAKIALNKHYKNSRKYKSPRGRKQAMTYDMNHSVSADRIVTDSRFRRSPHKYDFRGLDDGKAVRKARSQKQLANDAKLRGMSRDDIFGQRGGKGRKR